MARFPTKERKKEFDKIFKEKIIPFFNTYGFQQHTKTSKRLFKELGNELFVFLYFEFRTFGSGFYNMNIVYYDTELGAVNDDVYLTSAQIKVPHMKGNNAEELNASADVWIEEVQLKIIPFIEQHATHKAILNSDQFYFPYGREAQIKALLQRKSA
jgi:hypothetical protein